MDASAKRTITTALSAMAAGDAGRARAILDENLRSLTDPVSRAELLCLRARLDPPGGLSESMEPDILATVAQVEPIDPVVAGRLLLELVLVKLYRRDADALATAVRAQELTATADPFVRARADIARGLAHVFEFDYDAAHEFLLRSVDAIRVGGPPHEIAQLLQEVVTGLATVERYDEAMALCRRHVRVVRSVGADGLLPIVLAFLANTAYFVSDFEQMETAAAEGLELARGQQQDPLAAYCRGMVALARTLTDDADTTGEELEASVADLLPTSMKVLAALPLMGLGLREMTRGDWSAAADAYARLRAFYVLPPPTPGILHWRADEVEALWRAGRADDARTRLEQLVAQRAGYGPWEQAVTSRVAALLATTAEEAQASFLDALAHHQQSTSSFERARTELCYAEWLVARGRGGEARAHLESARTAFGDVGVTSWRERAQCLLGQLPAAAGPDTACGTAVRAFGPLTLIRDGVETRVAVDTQGRLLRALVAAGGSMHVEHMIDVLWPDASGDAGGARLRNVLARVRRSYGPVVVRDGSALRWAEGVEIDVERFRELSRRAAALRTGDEAASLATAAVALYRDELLPLERYDADVIAARERMHRLYLSMLDLLADHELAAGRAAEAADRLRAATEADPLDEARHVRLAALLLDQGRRLQARAVLAHAVAVLGEHGLPVPAQLAELEARLADPEV